VFENLSSPTLLLLGLWQAPASQQGGLIMLLVWVVMLGGLYVLFILPNQRRQKKWQAMLQQLKAGDRVVTSGGLRGTIIAVKDDSLHLRVPPDNLRLEVTKASVVTVSTDDK
jgi:preprotein translocase subunit YajC